MINYIVKSVKNVIWPPQNPPEQEESEGELPHPILTSHLEPSSESPRSQPVPQMPAPWLTKQSRSDPDSHHVKFLDEVMDDKCVSHKLSSVNSHADESSMTSSVSITQSSMQSAQSSMQSAQSSTQSMEFMENIKHENISQSSQQSMSSSEFRQEQMNSSALQTIYQCQTSIPITTTYETPLSNSNSPMTIGSKSVSQSENKYLTNDVMESAEAQPYVKHKQSICSAEVSNITERKSPMDCVETIGEALECQQLVAALTSNNGTPRPPSPTPEDKPSPIDEKNCDGMNVPLDSFNASNIDTDSMSSFVKENTESESECKVETFGNMNTSIKTLNETYEESSLECKKLPPSTIPNPVPRLYESPMLSALTIAPERPYSPLPQTSQGYNISSTYESVSEQNNVMQKNMEEINNEATTSQTLCPSQEVDSHQEFKRSAFSSIPPIKPHIPNKVSSEAVPMPEETVPYFPPEIPINIEPKEPRGGAVSPFVSALTIAPNRCYTPLGSQPIERGSLVEALTIASDRPYTPLVAEDNTITNNSMAISSHLHNITKVTSQSSTSFSQDCIRPVATQPCQSSLTQTSKAPIQTVCQLQSSTQSSAFKPVIRNIQTFPPPPPEEFAGLQPAFPPISNELKTAYGGMICPRSQSKTSNESFSQIYQTSQSEEVHQMQIQQSTISKSYESSGQISNAQCEKLSTTAKRASSGLQKPANIPCYQKNLEQLPSQRGQTPEITNEPAVLQAPVMQSVAPESIDPHKKVITYQEPQVMKTANDQFSQKAFSTFEMTSQNDYHTSAVKISNLHKDMPITMTFQPVTEDVNLRTTPIMRSRPTTPSMINKPAPLIPHYQMNLVAVEHSAAESNLYEPSSPDVSRSPTPKRSKSPAPGPPPNPLKAQAPRLKDNIQMGHSLLSQATNNLRREHECVKTNFQSGVEIFNASGARNWAQSQQSAVQSQQKQLSKIGFHSQEASESGAFSRMSEFSSVNQQSVSSASETRSQYETGNTSVLKTKRVFEEYERTQAAKVTEIERNSGGIVSLSSQYPVVNPQAATPGQSCVQSKLPQIKSFEPPALPASPVLPSRARSRSQSIPSFPPAASPASKPEQRSGPPLLTHSGANNNTSGPVCDPTPSAGAGSGGGLGVGARGKTFGVSSAPKRGRGILNKAAGPGTRVPLCAHCNGHIRYAAHFPPVFDVFFACLR